jgi:hypothetical protein
MVMWSWPATSWLSGLRTVPGASATRAAVASAWSVGAYAMVVLGRGLAAPVSAGENPAR